MGFQRKLIPLDFLMFLYKLLQMTSFFSVITMNNWNHTRHPLSTNCSSNWKDLYKIFKVPI